MSLIGSGESGHEHEHVPHLFTKHMHKVPSVDGIGQLERILHRDHSLLEHQKEDHVEGSHLHAPHKHFDYHTSHAVCDELEHVGQRPPASLGRLLKFKSDRDSAKRKVYSKFLLAADVATQDLVYAPMDVKGSYKYRLVGEDEKGKVMNSALMEIFMFYATLDQVYTATFDASELQNETMNLRELHIMCEDLRVTPRLIAFKELKMLWKAMAADRLNGMMVQEKMEPWNKMVYDDFLEYFIRMALYIYNKPGLKRLILSTTGFMPSPTEMVECLCSYTKLGNIYAVRNHIKTVGRATQGALNYRSAGELGDASSARNKQTNRDENQAKIDAALRTRDAQKRARGPLPTLAAPGVHFSTQQAEEPVTELRPMRSPKRIVRSRSELLPPALYKGLCEGGRGVQGGDDSSSQGGREAAPAVDSSLDSIVLDSDSDGEEEDEVDENGSPKYNFRSGCGKAVATAGRSKSNATVLALEEVNNQYSPDLLRVLQQYSYAPTNRSTGGVSSSHGPYADMDSIPRGAECVVRLHITNRIDDDLRVDVTCRDFESENARVTTFPSRLISGLTRPVSVSFTVEAAERSVLGFIDITAISLRKKSMCVVSCPVFYNVERAHCFILGKTASQQCTIRSLPILLKKTLKITTSLDMNFENRALNKSVRVNKTVNTLRKADSVTASNNNSVATPSASTVRPATSQEARR